MKFEGKTNFTTKILYTGNMKMSGEQKSTKPGEKIKFILKKKNDKVQIR